MRWHTIDPLGQRTLYFSICSDDLPDLHDILCTAIITEQAHAPDSYATYITFADAKQMWLFVATVYSNHHGIPFYHVSDKPLYVSPNDPDIMNYCSILMPGTKNYLDTTDISTILDRCVTSVASRGSVSCAHLHTKDSYQVTVAASDIYTLHRFAGFIKQASSYDVVLLVSNAIVHLPCIPHYVNPNWVNNINTTLVSNHVDRQQDWSMQHSGGKFRMQSVLPYRFTWFPDPNPKIKIVVVLKVNSRTTKFMNSSAYKFEHGLVFDSNEFASYVLLYAAHTRQLVLEQDLEKDNDRLQQVFSEPADGVLYVPFCSNTVNEYVELQVDDQCIPFAAVEFIVSKALSIEGSSKIWVEASSKQILMMFNNTGDATPLLQVVIYLRGVKYQLYRDGHRVDNYAVRILAVMQSRTVALAKQYENQANDKVQLVWDDGKLGLPVASPVDEIEEFEEEDDDDDNSEVDVPLAQSTLPTKRYSASEFTPKQLQHMYVILKQTNRFPLNESSQQLCMAMIEIKQTKERFMAYHEFDWNTQRHRWRLAYETSLGSKNTYDIVNYYSDQQIALILQDQILQSTSAKRLKA